MKNVQTLMGPLFDSLDLVKNKHCKNCDVGEQFKRPLLPWYIGSRFSETSERIVFVGKTHRDDLSARSRHDRYQDRSGEVEGDHGYWNGSWAFWSYTKAIIERVYGESVDSLQRVAITNLVKCASTANVDRTTPGMIDECVRNIGVIWRELAKLEARNIVFYTYHLYPSSLENPPISNQCLNVNGSNIDTMVDCGAKQIGFWERECLTEWHPNVRILVTSHPGTKKKDDFVDRIAGWIADSKR